MLTLMLLALLLAQPQATPSASTPPTPAPVAPSVSEPRDISALIEPILKKHAVPGIAAAAVLDGKIVAIGVAGVREIGKPEAATTNDLWHLGSCTKAMTATLAAVMIESGELSWETTLGEVFPEIPMKGAWKSVTLRQLLTNRSGAPAGLDKDGLWAKLWTFEGTPVDARLKLLAGVVAHDPQAAPGSKFIYSNAGFAMAGAMLERKAGMSWEELITKRLFKPVGITTAGFGSPGDAKSLSQPRGHRGGKAIQPGKNADNPVAIGPAGIVHMTIADWARFALLHAESRAPEPLAGVSPARPLLPASAWAKLHEPYPAATEKDKDIYAAGWLVATRPWAKGSGPTDTGRVLTHGGSNTMWHCVTWVAPERRFAIVIACNQGDGDAPKALDAVAAALIQDLLKK